MLSRLIFVMLLVPAMAGAQVVSGNEAKHFVPGTAQKWYVDDAGRMNDVKLAPFLGQEGLWLKANTHVMIEGAPFTTGTVEFDLAPTRDGHFTAFMFRRDSGENYENIYFRAHQSGKFQAMQYAPTINGSTTWQLYPKFNRRVELPREAWTHVKVMVGNRSLAVYLNGATVPILAIPRMRAISTSGAVGFWGRKNRDRDAWASVVANVVVTKGSVPEIEAPVSPCSTNRMKIERWQVSVPAETEGRILSMPADLQFLQPVLAEEDGLVNVSRIYSHGAKRMTVFARTSIERKNVKPALLHLGYSDDVTVFLNGKAVFTGTNGWESRYPEYMGLVDPGNDAIFLPLVRGENDLTLAVSEARFGWGFIAELEEDPAGSPAEQCEIR